ncbi:MAG: DUF4249 domain-containing protein [Muribaculaceae bacterium]|nr:DUF4249 domain-containing protein [Muribaculaceae bacterium]
MKPIPFDYIPNLTGCKGNPALRNLPFFRIFVVGIISLSFCLISCEKELDFKYHDIPPLTVIEAQVTPEKATCQVSLTVPMDSPLSEATRLTDATVYMTDLTTGETFPLYPDSEGVFKSREGGVIQHDYRLSVEHAGLLHSAEARMYPEVKIISSEFSWIKMPYDDVAVLQCRYRSASYSPDSEECYWVKVYRNGKIYQWSEQSSRTSQNGIMTFFAMTTRRDLDAEDEKTALHAGDKITISISRISRAMHDYLEALSNDSNGPAMFVTSPLSADTNVSARPCLGYFIANTPSSDSLIFHPDSISYASPH